MAPLTETERRDFWECGEERYQTGSVILTSQMPVARWHGQIGDPTVADGTSTGSCITLTMLRCAVIRCFRTVLVSSPTASILDRSPAP
ncbi:MAG TPA: ATP-binding protein [Bryobacteraceae bacterium]|nr:ATP-binding protein [Bryobacteraceae bacterium]